MLLVKSQDVYSETAKFPSRWFKLFDITWPVRQQPQPGGSDNQRPLNSLHCIFCSEVLIIHRTKDLHCISAQTGCGDAKASGTNWLSHSGFHPHRIVCLHCNKYVIGLTDHSWKILGPKPKPVLKAITSTMLPHHMAGGRTETGWANGDSDFKSTHHCHTFPVTLCDCRPPCDCSELRLFISIS